MTTDPASLPIGLEHTLEEDVKIEYPIPYHDLRLPPVLSTPAMIELMKVAAAKAVAPKLAPGEITVGARIEVGHLKACTTGAQIRVSAHYEGAKGRFLSFEVTAHCGDLLIGRGRVFRAILDPSRHGRKL